MSIQAWGFEAPREAGASMLGQGGGTGVAKAAPPNREYEGSKEE